MDDGGVRLNVRSNEVVAGPVEPSVSAEQGKRGKIACRRPSPHLTTAAGIREERLTRPSLSRDLHGER